MVSLILPDRELIVKAAGIESVSGNTDDIVQRYWKGVHILVDVTAFTGANPTLDLRIEVKDPLTAGYFSIGGLAVITGITTRQFTVYPSLVELVNVRLSRVLAQVWRVRWTIGGTSPSFTFGIGGIYIP